MLELPPEDEGPAPLDPPELLDPASQLPESCAASGDFFLKSYGEFEFCLTSDSATEEMAFEDTDGNDEDDEDDDAVAREDDADDEAPPAADDEEAAEEHPCVEDEDDAAEDEGGAVLVLVLPGTFGLFGLFTLPLLVELLLLLLLLLLEELEEAGLADDPKPGAAASTGPLFCWPGGAAPTFGAGMFWHGGSQSADVLDGSGIRFPFLRDRRTYDRDEENEALGIFLSGLLVFC